MNKHQKEFLMGLVIVTLNMSGFFSLLLSICGNEKLLVPLGLVLITSGMYLIYRELGDL